MRTFLFLTVALWASIGYTGEWVASVPVAPVPPPLVVETPVPAITLCSATTNCSLWLGSLLL